MSALAVAEPTQDTRRNEAIDGFRGVAILFVLSFHYLVRWAPPEFSTDIYGFSEVYPEWLKLGKYGVHIFFVISGMVITMTVLRSEDWIDFSIRRLDRLWPALAISATFSFIVVNLWGPPEFHRTIADYFGSLTLLAPDLHLQAVDGAYWSLAIEVKFYAVVAIAFLLFKQNFWICIAVVGLLSGLTAVTGAGDSLLFAQYWPYFILGMAGWYGLFEGRKLISLALGAEGIALFLISSPGIEPSILIITATVIMFLMIKLNIRMPGFSNLGRISYSLYLIHQVIGVTLIRALVHLGLPDLLAVLTTTTMMITLAYLGFNFVEIPAGKAVRRAGHMVRHRFEVGRK